VKMSSGLGRDTGENLNEIGLQRVSERGKKGCQRGRSRNKREKIRGQPEKRVLVLRCYGVQTNKISVGVGEGGEGEEGKPYNKWGDRKKKGRFGDLQPVRGDRHRVLEKNEQEKGDGILTENLK